MLTSEDSVTIRAIGFQTQVSIVFNQILICFIETIPIPLKSPQERIRESEYQMKNFYFGTLCPITGHSFGLALP
ncbi:unnamed protein product [Rhizophagus irregularis]|nr:unnamed protein product [Rhizophagus irregularis]